MTAPHLVFTPEAQRLEARALVAVLLPASLERERVRLTFAPWWLDETARRAFRSQDELVLRSPETPARERASLSDPAVRDPAFREDAGPPGRGPALWELSGPRQVLSELARDATDFAVLLAAHDHATRLPGPPQAMGIVNVTPDSFSDGGAYFDPERALRHARSLVEDGAEWLDVGGESTRPGSEGVTEDEERRRVAPVLEGLAAWDPGTVRISIDTQKSAIAGLALDHGAAMVNDVSAGRSDPEILPLVAERGAELCLMHMQGRPRSMQARPSYEDVVRETTAFLRARAAAAWSSGVAPDRIVLDPGIGFGKRLEDNLALLRALPELRSLGCRVLAGVSRKSFLSALTGAAWNAEKTEETSAAVATSVLFGAEILRVHDVRSSFPVLRVAGALAGTVTVPDLDLR